MRLDNDRAAYRVASCRGEKEHLSIAFALAEVLIREAAVF